MPVVDDPVTELALAAAVGDRRALEGFVRATQADVWRLAAHLAGRADADDITQDTYLRAIRALPRFRGDSSARTWLLTIARRAVVDHVRAAIRQPRTTPIDNDEEETERRRSTPRFEEAALIRLMLDELPDERREAIVLTQLVGLSYAEAAEVCGCAVGTIRSRVARARDDLVRRVRAERTGSS